jgi:dTMP kinase
VNRARLVAFEGIDGSGKSTQLALLAGSLRAAGIAVVETREPTAGEWGRRIRAMARSGERVTPEQELAWFVADRREHVEGVLRPALAGGSVVLTDRYFLSTVAYQGARGMDPVRLLADAEAEFPAPDLALVFDVEPEVGLARAALRQGPAEPSFEEAGYLDAVARIFRSLDRAYVVHLDAARPREVVQGAVLDAVRRLLGIP